LFKPGYDADVKFLTFEQQDAVTVPKTAVFKDGEQHAVFTLKDGKIAKTPVTKGVELQSDVVITAGLSENDVVITDASQTELAEGKPAVGA
jgi:HlyD family secretion protein